MDDIIFMLISGLEWLALIVLTFAMFKLVLRGSWGQLIFASFLLTLLSYIVFVVFKWSTFGPLIQLPIVFLFFWQMFRIPIFYAGLVSVNGYVAYSLLQSIIFYALQVSGVTFQPDTPLAFYVQTITACLAFFTAWQLIKKNAGFTFVPDTERVKVDWNGLNVRLLIMAILGYFAISSFSILYYSGYTALLILILVTLIYGFLQYLVFQKEYVQT